MFVDDNTQAYFVVSRLRTMGYRVLLITGDNKRTAASVGRKMGLPEECVIADVRFIFLSL